MSNEELFQMASKLKEECLKRPKCGECLFAFEWADRSACALDGEPDQWELAEVEKVSEVRKWQQEQARTDNNDGNMTLDEAIAHAEEIAKANDAMCKSYSTAEAKEHIRKCAADHRQLASWLRELKERRAKE